MTDCQTRRAAGSIPADEALSLAGGVFYDRAAAGGLKLAAESGVEMIELSDDEKARWNAALAPAIEAAMGSAAGDMTVAEIVTLMKGE